MESPIIESKLSPPKLDSELVQRTTQIKQLDSAIKRRLTLVTAAAGYGKTTLVAQWKLQSTLQSAWLSVDVNDNDLERFIKYLVGALRVAAPGCCQEVSELIASPQQISLNQYMDALITGVSNLEHLTVLVIDDFHLVANSEICELVNRLVQHLPDCLRLVIIARTESSWPLSLWRLRGWLAEFGNQELCFSLSESRELVAIASSTSGKAQCLDDERLERWHHETEGWPTGLQLTLLSLENQSQTLNAKIDSSSNRHEVFNLLIDEVCKGLPAELSEFLELTAPLNRFCVELCDAIHSGLDDNSSLAKRSASRELIEELQRRRLFIVSLDDQSEWFRYHHLFQQLLMRQFRENVPKSKADAIYRIAGDWFSDQELIEESLDCLIQGGAMSAAAEVLWKALPGILTTDLSRRSLSRILEKFPKEAIQGYPEMMLAKAFVCIARFELKRLAQVLDDAFEAFKVAEIPNQKQMELKGVWNALQSVCSYWNGEAEKAWRCGEKALRLLPSKYRISRTYATIYGVGGLMFCGDIKASFDWIERSITEDTASGTGITSGYQACKAMMYAMNMNLDGIDQSTRKMRQLNKIAPMLDYWLAYAPYLEGLAAYERNQLSQAMEAFNEALNFGVKLNPRHYHDILVTLSRVSDASGDRDAAWRYANEAREFAVATSDPTSIRVSDAAELRLWATQGQALVDMPPRPQIMDAVCYWIEIPNFIYAELLLQSTKNSDLEYALAYIQEGLDLVEKLNHRRHVVVLTLLKSIALEALGRQEEAQQLLTRCLRWGKELGLLRTFLDRGPRLHQWLERIQLENPGDEYVKYLVDSFAGDVGIQEKPLSIVDPTTLSQREMDVLELMQERFSNKQIGVKLHITSETVKKHAQSIYRKLGVNRRREAVIEAENLGILRPKN